MDLISIYWISIILMISLLILLWYNKPDYNYIWKNAINGPCPLPLFGTYIYFLLEERFKVELKWFNKFGKIFRVFENKTSVLRIGDPKFIKQILVKDFHLFAEKTENIQRHSIADRALNYLRGDDWKRVRSVLSITLTSGKLKKLYSIVRECINDLVNNLALKADLKNDVDMRELFSNFTLNVICTCAFGVRLNPSYRQNSNLLTKQLIDNRLKYLKLILNLTMPNFILKYLNIDKNASANTKDDFSFIKDIIKQRKHSQQTHNDFIQLLLNLEIEESKLRDDNQVNESHHGNEDDDKYEIEKKLFNGIKKYITEDEIIANAHLFLLAGYQTTSSTLSFCTQELALNPDVQEKLYSEIISSVDTNGEIDYDLLTKLPYLDAVISETLRLHSTTYVLPRIAAQDYKLGDTGITIMKGQKIEIPNFAIHRCEEYFPNADQFIPERFLPENRNKIIPYTYLPFGGGPRNCVGMRLALLVIKLALVYTLKHYCIIKSINTDIPVRIRKDYFWYTPDRVIVKIVKRE